MIQPTRILSLNKQAISPNRSYILYWMEATQRTSFNHALSYAVQQANDLNKPLIVFFGLNNEQALRYERHMTFMCEGLVETAANLAGVGILFVIQKVSPQEGVFSLSQDACLIVTDAGYLRYQKEWRSTVASKVDVQMIQVESDVVVPVEVVSNKSEFAARTIRPKIHRHLADYLAPLPDIVPKVDSLGLNFNSIDMGSIDALLNQYRVDPTVPAVQSLRGGYREAIKHLGYFLEHRIEHYHELRNDPSLDYQSNLSPYLRYGQISPLEILIRLETQSGEGIIAFIEELLVRRELSMNFVHFNQNYDSYSATPAWAKASLDEHRMDPRPHLYSLEELEAADTDDEYWNAAQIQMVQEGKMHGYMRMYWAKKILEWSPAPEEAFQRALYLNDKYELDGCSANGFTGVAWCFGTHDRPWSERPVFGKIRYMNANGLKRKFAIDDYVRTHTR